MRGKVFLVQWDAASAEQHAEKLREQGWKVEVESQNSGRAYRMIRTSVPDLVVLDLRARAQHGREVGGALRELKATRDVPIVCIEDGDEARAVTRDKIADVVFATQEALPAAIAEAVAIRAELARHPPSSHKRRVAAPAASPEDESAHAFVDASRIGAVRRGT